MTERTVLCVDIPTAVAEVATAVERTDRTTITQTSVEAAADVLSSRQVDCVVTGYDLPDGSGLDILSSLRERQPQVPCILFTDTVPGEVDTDSFGDLVVEYLNRNQPGALDRLDSLVEDLIAHRAQVGFVLPEDEHSRLAALAEYDVEALPIEESFERLTDLVAAHFGVPVSFIGLIGEREEEVLACHGADWESMTREDTICTHSMLEADVMVVSDIHEDRRFADNDALTNLGVRSYAGANMTTPDGQVIGQLCLFDYEPREYDQTERRRLQQFADTAMEILELRKSLRAARTNASA